MPSVAKNKQVTGESVTIQAVGNQQRQPVYALAHIGRSQHQVNLGVRAEAVNHFVQMISDIFAPPCLEQ